MKNIIGRMKAAAGVLTGKLSHLELSDPTVAKSSEPEFVAAEELIGIAGIEAVLGITSATLARLRGTGFQTGHPDFPQPFVGYYGAANRLDWRFVDICAFFHKAVRDRTYRSFLSPTMANKYDEVQAADSNTILDVSALVSYEELFTVPENKGFVNPPHRWVYVYPGLLPAVISPTSVYYRKTDVQHAQRENEERKLRSEQAWEESRNRNQQNSESPAPWSFPRTRWGRTTAGD